MLSISRELKKSRTGWIFTHLDSKRVDDGVEDDDDEGEGPVEAGGDRHRPLPPPPRQRKESSPSGSPFCYL